jgi:putative nucleotidyltransferase with HDIG domain
MWERPGFGVFAWGLIWLTVMTLRVLDFPEFPAGIEPDKPAPATIRAAIDFDGPADIEVVPAGQLLAVRGAILTVKDVDVLRSYRHALQTHPGRTQWLVRRVGDGVLLLLTVIAAAFFLNLAAPVSNAENNRRVLLLWVLTLFTLTPVARLLIAGRIAAWPGSGDVAFILPVALAPMLSAILLGPVPAAVTGVWTALAAAVLADYSLPVFITGACQGLLVVGWAHRARTRLAIFRLGLMAGAAGMVCAAGFGLVGYSLGEVLLRNCIFSLTGGLLAALATLLLLPLLELMFKIATDISLLELADMEHPLLKRLAMEAPGTYQHSLMVANLAQAGAVAVGGNALRARIAAYFHDIGKLVKPDFFAENISFRGNPHDDLTPRMSCLVIISHVKEGVSLALRHKLPQPVLDGIEQHHGTGMVSFFYHKAASNAPSSGQALPAPDDFRYPGPKPQARETAVLCLADSIEAASRSLPKITPSSIEGLVRDIMEERLRDGQLDECDLTMAQLHKLQRVFVFTLTNMLHGRISYPTTDENRNKLEPNYATDQHQPGAEVDAIPDGTSRAP